MNKERIGKYIKFLRERNNLTQEELAKKVPVSREAVSKWETGISHIKWHIMKKLKICFILKGKITI